MSDYYIITHAYLTLIVPSCSVKILGGFNSGSIRSSLLNSQIINSFADDVIRMQSSMLISPFIGSNEKESIQVIGAV